MALYARHIKPDGVIALQTTNRYVHLLPVVKRLAAELGFEAVVVSDAPDEDPRWPGYLISSTDQARMPKPAESADRRTAPAGRGRGDLGTWRN